MTASEFFASTNTVGAGTPRLRTIAIHHLIKTTFDFTWKREKLMFDPVAEKSKSLVVLL